MRSVEGEGVVLALDKDLHEVPDEGAELAGLAGLAELAALAEFAGLVPTHRANNAR